MAMLESEFFNIIIHKDEGARDLLGLCAGFECHLWRKEQLVDHLKDYILSFALPYSEYINISGKNAFRKLQDAVNNIYKTDKFKSRGEFGELMLHAIIQELYKTIPVVSKIFYKDGPNETVKGFDAVHTVIHDDKIELWLGEVKFYKHINKAIDDVVEEIENHVKIDYLRNEFLAITNKIDPNTPGYERFQRLFNPKTSLDEVFDCACIPVLLTYDSSILKCYDKNSIEYQQEISSEFLSIYEKFKTKLSSKIPVTIHLFLLPLNTKEELIECLDKKLKIWQQM